MGLDASTGYAGGGLGESVLSSVEAKMIRRAIGEGWNIPEESMTKVLTSLLATCDQSEDFRAKVGAGQAIVNICKLNLDARKWLTEKLEKRLGAASDGADPEKMTDAELRSLVERGAGKVGSGNGK